MSRGSQPYLRPATALGAAVGVFGMTSGVLSSAAGMGAAKTVARSLLTFTGASPFVVVVVLAAVVTALLLRLG